LRNPKEALDSPELFVTIYKKINLLDCLRRASIINEDTDEVSLKEDGEKRIVEV
jgi:hypothetical protein